mmetsp:Transcript_7758/g.16083  ORF Transcript_7758/g.16083 Transcript_7758/m.16083 type:complete len:80 (+) Transcript_7758:3-242(+)
MFIWNFKMMPVPDAAVVGAVVSSVPSILQLAAYRTLPDKSFGQTVSHVAAAFVFGIVFTVVTHDWQLFDGKPEGGKSEL